MSITTERFFVQLSLRVTATVQKISPQADAHMIYCKCQKTDRKEYDYEKGNLYDNHRF